MDLASRLLLYILIANVGYMMFSLARRGFRPFAGYLLQLAVLQGFMILCLFRWESGFWAVIASGTGVFVLIGVPLLIQKQIERLISEQRFAEIEPLARWKANLEWSGTNAHLLDIARITAGEMGSEAASAEAIRGLLGKGEPYDGMTRVFLGMLLFHSRKFERLLQELLVPGRPFEDYPFEELLYIVRGFLETGDYDSAVLAQMALERQVATRGSGELYGNLMVCRLIFFAFMGWETDYFSLLESDDPVLAGLPEALKKYWGGFSRFNAGQFTAGEALMEEGLVLGAEELPEHWVTWMKSRLAGIRENKEFFFNAVVPRLKEIRACHQPGYHQLVQAATESAKPPELSFQATKWLIGLNLGVFLLVNLRCNLPELQAMWAAGGWEPLKIPLLFFQTGLQDMLALVDCGANCGFLVTQGEWFRLFTHQFLHLGWIHILMNVLALWYLGPPLETLLGPKLFCGAFVFCGICGGIASVQSQIAISVGASGAVAGLFGMTLIFESLGDRRSRVFGGQGFLPTLVFIIIINLLIGLIEKGIDNSAHVGGFVGGLLAGVVGLILLRDRLAKIIGELVAVVFLGVVFVWSSWQFRESHRAGGYPERFAGPGEVTPSTWPFQVNIPLGWKIVGSHGSGRPRTLQGPLHERIDLILATNRDPPGEVLEEYLEERTRSMAETREVEFQRRFGPTQRQLGGKVFHEIRWRLVGGSHGWTERDLFCFEPGRLLLVQCILPTYEDESYDKVLLGMLETLKLK